MRSITHTESVATELSTHGDILKVESSTTETSNAVIGHTCRAPDSIGKGSSKRRLVSCLNTLDRGKRLKPVLFLQSQIVSLKDRSTSKAVRTAAPAFLTYEEERMYRLTSSVVGSSPEADCSWTSHSFQHPCLGFTHDIVSMAIKQNRLVSLATVSQVQDQTISLPQSESCRYGVAGKEGHDRQGSTQTSAARGVSTIITHATVSDNAVQGNPTTTSAKETTTGNGLAARSGNFMTAQNAALGSGDSGDDPDDQKNQLKPLRGHEIDMPDGERKLMVDLCAKCHQQSHLKPSQNSESSMEEGQDRPSYDGERSCSWVKDNTQNFVVGPAQTSGSAPAQTRIPRDLQKNSAESESDNRPACDDDHLHQALIGRSRMVRASDITGEPSVDAPWTHHMRPSSLLLLRRGAEGYGGQGGLASLPDAQVSSRVESERVATETLLGSPEVDTTNQQTATHRYSFSSTASGSPTSEHVPVTGGRSQGSDDGRLLPDLASIISQHTALVEGPREELTYTQQGLFQVISQHTALVEGPPEELLATYAPRNQGLVEAFLPATTNMQTSEPVESSEPRRPSAPHITPQGPLDSPSDDEPSICNKHQGGTVRDGIGKGFSKRRRQPSSWSSVLCCLGESGLDRLSSPETEPSPKETARSQEPTVEHHNHDRQASSSLAEGSHGFSSSQGPAQAQVHQQDHSRIPEHSSAATDTPAPSEIPSGTESGHQAIPIPKCPRTRFARNNERWRDPTSRS